MWYPFFSREDEGGCSVATVGHGSSSITALVIINLLAEGFHTDMAFVVASRQHPGAVLSQFF